MRWRWLLQLAWRSIVRNPGRSALTMLGVIIGVASVVVMIAIGQGARGEIRAQVDAMGTNLLIVRPGAAATAGVSGGAGTQATLKIEDVELLSSDADALLWVSPVLASRTRVVGPAGNWRTAVQGVDASYPEIRSWDTQAGRFFSPEEVRAKRKVVLLGATVARSAYGDADPVGQTVRLRGVPFEIIGVLASKGQTVDGNDQDDVVILPYTTLQTRLAGWQWLSQIVASAEDGREDEAKAQIASLLRESHRLGAREADDFEVQDQAQLTATAQATADVMTWLLSAVAGVSLLVGGIGIMNIMLVSVTERTREIGIRRAVGARGRDVLAQFLVESVVLSSLGGMVGAGLGLVAAWGVGQLTGWSTAVTPSSLALAVGFSVAVGVFFGWYPARRAARLDPIEALRNA